MKYTKKFATFLVLVIFSIIFSVTVDAQDSHRKSKRLKKTEQYYNGNHGNTNSVGVPLDGGLLAVLAGAGIAYFASRKRKKNQE